MKKPPPAARTKIAGVFLMGCAWLLPSWTAAACPVCDTETGMQVREGIFGDDFWGTLAAVISPFPVLLLVLAFMHFGWPCFGGRSLKAASTNTGKP